MIRSMTGYGRGENIIDNRKFIVEIKSVNHRYNDINIRIPRSMHNMEDIIRKKISEKISRGKTDVYILFETNSKEDIKITLNEILVDCYIREFNYIKQKYNINDEISFSLISKIPDIITVERVSDNDDLLSSILVPALDSALNEFIQFREKEGTALKNDILYKLKYISCLVDKIKVFSPKVVLEYRDKLKIRLNELLGNDNKIEESRLITEIAIFADKCSVDEEIIRLYSHIEQVKTILNEDEPVGRKLDFIIQEMNREANTISSKSNNIEITKISVELKSEIEKIREQVQNIE